ncbi:MULTISPECIES: PH domain-containing protein [unclassified Streptomyces]|uniref:PH domain-containing protein n=1 Tax=unclassified Streptomyces TaxID=2593676 RepID=UPI0023B9B35E|nr:PH domain-containing protein [Streptomyces sp. AM 3-1-1]WEH27720.1 PH domain-containing protein [Streptomyces sp. AM 3-1-1]
MTTPDPAAPEPDPAAPEPDPAAPESSPAAPEPSSAAPDRIYRSPAGIAAGVFLLILSGWLGADAIILGEGRTPWIAIAALLCVIPLITAFTLRPAVYANTERLRVRNPFRTIVLPWKAVATLRSGYSNEVVDADGKVFQLWALPVSLRGRKRAARAEARAMSRGEGKAGHTATSVHEVRHPQGDVALGELRELAGDTDSPHQGLTEARWCWSVIAPAAAGALLLIILLLV